MPPPGEEKITMSPWELEKEREHAVIKEKLTSLEDMVPQIHASMRSLDAKVGDIPMEILACRDRMDKNMKDYMHSEFVTNVDLQMFESKLETQIGKDINNIRTDLMSVRTMMWKATWIISGFISAGIFMTWLLSHTNIQVF